MNLTETTVRRLSLWLVLLALGGCGSRADRFEAGRAIDMPIAFDDALLLVSAGEDEAHLLDLRKERLGASAKTVSIPHGVTQVVRRAGDHDEVLLLSLGRQGSAAEVYDPAVLAVMTSDGSQREYELGNPFDRLVQSPDGRFVFLSRSGNTGRLLDADTQVAIVDLDAEPASGVTFQSLTNLGEAPQQVTFSPPMDIAGQARRLAVIFGGRKLALLDLTNPGRRDTTVELTSDLNRNVTPQQVLFDPHGPRIFVRANGAADIYALQLVGPVDNPGGNDFRPTVDLLDAGGNPGSMTLIDGGESLRLLVTNAARPELTLVDLETSRGTQVPLPFQANRSYVAELMGDDGAPVLTAMLWNGSTNRVLFASIDELDARGDQALETSTVMPEPVLEVTPMPGEPRVVVRHQNRGMTIVDLAARTVTPLSSSTPLGNATVDLEHQRVWVAPTNQRAIAYLDLATGTTRDLLLDAPIQHFVPMLAVGRLVVLHPSDLGYLTILEADAPERETAQSLRGFLVADLLD